MDEDLDEVPLAALEAYGRETAVWNFIILGGLPALGHAYMGDWRRGFSVGYNGGSSPGILNWPANTFCISNHANDETGSVALAIKRDGGSVGIGTSTPSSKLDVVGTVSALSLDILNESVSVKVGAITTATLTGENLGGYWLLNSYDSI